MWVPAEADYQTVLHAFQDRFNGHERAKKLVKNWDRFILLNAIDTGSKFALVIKDQVLTDVQPVSDYDDQADDLVHMQGEEEVLKNIFSGVCNPATALVDGALAVFSKERDKVKLEALAMIIWRIG